MHGATIKIKIEQFEAMLNITHSRIYNVLIFFEYAGCLKM
jgi:hypothetical protein